MKRLHRQCRRVVFRQLKAAEGKIQAPVRGTVTEIMITTGDFSSDQTAIRMADASGESCLTVSVSARFAASMF